MTKILFLVLAFLQCFVSKADGWPSHQFEFSIQLKGGKTIKGHATTGFQFEKDSLHNTGYLLTILNQKYRWNDSYILDSFAFYKQELRYTPEKESPERVFSILLKRSAIHISLIKKITVIEYHVDLSEGLMNNLTSADTNWANKKYKSKVSFVGYLCAFEVYVHVSSKKTEQLLSKLRDLDRNASDMDKTGDTPEGEPTIDEKFEQLMKELIKEKVIVLWFCSC